VPLGFKVSEFTNHSLCVLFHVNSRNWNYVASKGRMNGGSDGKASGRRLFNVVFSDLPGNTERNHRIPD